MVTETFTTDTDWTVPDGVFNITVEIEGEAGEEDYTGDSPGGPGGRVVGELTDVRPGDVYSLRFGGGASGGQGEFGKAGDGGDAADIRPENGSLSDRLAVAAGGGGGARGDGDPAGGAGGPDTGADGQTANDSGGEGGEGGGGGSQSSGGLGGTSYNTADGEDGGFGDGGAGASDDFERGGGGGGGGYYGGGGGGAASEDTQGGGGGGGGGGSNYDDGLDSVTANERSTSTRTNGQGGLVTITYEQTPGAENLAITNTTATSNTLAWDAPTLPPEVDSVEQYRVYRDTDPGTVRADYTQIATTPTPGFEDVGLENGTEYHYRIGADLFVPEAEGTITITDFRGV